MKYPLRTLYINPTFRCNLRCGHCWVGEDLYGAPPETSLEHFKSIIEQAITLGLGGVKFTGGEPFLGLHTIELLKFAQVKGLNIVIETNATLITKEVAEILKAVKPSLVSVSLDSGEAEFHDQKRGVKGAFKRALEGIRHLNTVGIYPQLIMSLFKGDFDKNFSALLDLRKEMTFGSLKINPIINYGKAQNLENYHLEEVLVIYHKTLKVDRDLKIIFDLPPALRTLSDIQQNRCRCGILGIAGVLPDGKISICGIGLQFIELTYSIRDNLGEVWEAAPLFREIREVLPDKLEGVCAKCVWKKHCLGKCAAFTYAKNRTFRASFPLCQEAYDKGLFSKTALIES